jgi:DNA modification methylase
VKPELPINLIHGDARHLPLADASVQCIVTSPPYWGLRKYAGEQEIVWDGDPAHAHRWTSTRHTGAGRTNGKERWNHTGHGEHGHESAETNFCKCGAWRGAFGLEPTIDLYIQHTVEILRECWRVLRADGVLFWNIGDSYFASGVRKNNFDTFKPTYGTMGPMNSEKRRAADVEREMSGTNLKPKDLCLIPARVALAAQSDGWWVRSVIVWCKPNPMPESATDRPTNAYEHILMLTKSERYFWDADAVRERCESGPSDIRKMQESLPRIGGKSLDDDDPLHKANGHTNIGVKRAVGGTRVHGNLPGRDDGGAACNDPGQLFRNMRNVWMVATQPYSGAHFATFPEELPRRCILAATSAKGCCAQCGAPWERVSTPAETSGQSWNGDAMKNAGINRNEIKDFAGAAFFENYVPPRTVGWRPTCGCRGQRGQTVPCVVLDPFGGSGTTGRVALELRRRAVLVDIAYNAEYRALAERRTREVDVQLPFLS